MAGMARRSTRVAGIGPVPDTEFAFGTETRGRKQDLIRAVETAEQQVAHGALDSKKWRMKDVTIGKIKVRRWRALETGEVDPEPPQVFKRPRMSSLDGYAGSSPTKAQPDKPTEASATTEAAAAAAPLSAADAESVARAEPELNADAAGPAQPSAPGGQGDAMTDAPTTPAPAAAAAHIQMDDDAATAIPTSAADLGSEGGKMGYFQAAAASSKSTNAVGYAAMTVGVAAVAGVAALAVRRHRKPTELTRYTKVNSIATVGAMNGGSYGTAPSGTAPSGAVVA